MYFGFFRTLAPTSGNGCGLEIRNLPIINPHHSEKAERFKHQGWESLKSNPAYEVSLKYNDIGFRDSLPTLTPPIREGIEHEIHLKPGTQPISVRQWRRSSEQRKESRFQNVNSGLMRFLVLVTSSVATVSVWIPTKSM
ncbi:TPA: hypothetical protein N0F65_012968 [Lagenidium giganteum]|uniref:Uncharacterized protein n=1 Tax=Lagenidium giganteum TaxID=4803 RepID=A0AAV2Z3V5_9STRA|nr:TPA: hypothetical protein N0F65_012968 [Lagenidium giganteum]